MKKIKNFQLQIELSKYHNAIHNITEIFCNKYFKNVYEYSENDWIGSVGEVIEINDFFFNFTEIKIALIYNASKEKLFSYYEKSLETKKMPNLENYLKHFS
jgi:hypothetical protein